jgi:acyl dehydratase
MTSDPMGSAAQRFFEDVKPGEELPSIAFPLSVYRLVMAAGSNRDFNSIHHNSEYARSTGAREMYANTTFLLGTWERCVRDWIGMRGTIVSIRKFRMKAFNYVGDTTWVHAYVLGTRPEGDHGVVEIEVRNENSGGVTVGPGVVVATLPRREVCPQ